MSNAEVLLTELLRKKWQPLLGEKTVLTKFGNDAEYPGIYLLAYSGKNLEGKPIELKDIFYVGMSNSLGGIKQRLRQFAVGIEKNDLHSAAMRFYREYTEGPYAKRKERKRFFVCFVSAQCRVRKADRTANDLKIMGEIAKLEFLVLAHIKRKLGHEPRLNKK